MAPISQVKSAYRAIEILQLFQSSRQPCGMTEISQALGYPASSTTVLLKTLMRLGYLSFDRRAKSYFPTPKVTTLGDWIPAALFGSGEALEAMRDVHAATGESVSLSTANDVYVQYIQIIQSIHALRFHVDEGALRPLTRSASGWALMSMLPDGKIDNLVRRSNIATASLDERVPLADMMGRIRKIRQDGHAWAENIPFPSGATLCVPLTVTLRGQPVVIALGGALERMRANRARYLSILRQAALAAGRGPAEAGAHAIPAGD